MIGWYLVIGILYATYNMLFRTMDTDGGWFIPYAWIFGWPICWLGLLTVWIKKTRTKWKQKNGK